MGLKDFHSRPQGAGGGVKSPKSGCGRLALAAVDWLADCSSNAPPPSQAANNALSKSKNNLSIDMSYAPVSI